MAGRNGVPQIPRAGSDLPADVLQRLRALGMGVLAHQLLKRILHQKRVSERKRMKPAEAMKLALTVLSAVTERYNPDCQDLHLLQQAYPQFAGESADELACAVINVEMPRLITRGLPRNISRRGCRVYVKTAA